MAITFDPRSTCTSCNAKSALYTTFAECRDCGEQTCSTCADPGTWRDADLDEPESCLCCSCGSQAFPGAETHVPLNDVTVDDGV